MKDKNMIIVEFARLWGVYESEGGAFRDALECEPEFLLDTVTRWADEYDPNVGISEFFEMKLKDELNVDPEMVV